MTQIKDIAGKQKNAWKNIDVKRPEQDGEMYREMIYKRRKAPTVVAKCPEGGSANNWFADVISFY